MVRLSVPKEGTSWPDEDRAHEWSLDDAMLGDATVIRDRRAGGVPPEPSPQDVTQEAEGRYGNLKEIGRGGIGRVLVALDAHLGREVALKELLENPPLGPGNTLDEEARFLREARITGRLEHPSIVPVYELGKRADGTLYYTMRLVRGRTLRDVIPEAEGLRGRLGLLNHFVDLAQAIAYAHSRGVVHRDIKPENIMLGPFGETVVLDWGLAKVSGRPDPMGESIGSSLRRLASGETAMGLVMGTPAYMSPEQACGNVDKVDQRSDVWSLGAVLFEILTGVPPFRGPSAEQTLGLVQTKDAPAAEKLEPRVPRDLAAIAAKAMARDPEERYADARELVEDLLAFQSGRLVGAYRYSAVDLVRRFVSEHRATALAISLVLMSIVGGSVGTVAAYRNAEAERARAVAAESVAQEARRAAEVKEGEAHTNLAMALAEKSRLVEGELDHAAAGVFAAAAAVNSPFVATSPHAYPDLPERDAAVVAQSQLQVRSALFEALTHRQVEVIGRLDTGVDACAIDIAPDGRTLVSSDRSGRIHLWDLARRSVSRSFEGRGCASDLFIFPEADRVLYRTSDLRAFVLDVESGTHRRVSGKEHDVRRVALSPDGQHIFLAGKKAEVARLNARSLRVEMRKKLKEPRAIVVSPDGQWLAVGTQGGEVFVLDPRRLKIVKTFAERRGAWALTFSPDSERLAISGYSGRVVIRSLRGTDTTVLPGSTSTYGLAFAPDGETLLGASLERGRLWSIPERRIRQTFRVFPRGVGWLSFFPESKRFATSGFGPAIHLWQLVEPPVEALGGHSEPIFDISVAPDGKTLVSVDAVGELRWWDTKDARLLASVREPSAWALAHLEDPERVFSITTRGQVKAWSGKGAFLGVLQPELPQRRWSQGGIAANSERQLVAWTGAGGDVVLYDGASDSIVAQFSELKAQSVAVALSSNGALLAASDEDGGVVVWAVDGRVRLWTRGSAHKSVVSGLEFSPDGKRLATSGRDGWVRMWSALDGTQLTEVRAHRDWTNRVVFSPDGGRLLTSSDDKTFRVWSAEDLLPKLELRGPGQAVAGAFFPRGRRFAIGRGSAVEIMPTRSMALDLPAPALLETAERAAGLRLRGVALVPAGPRAQAPPAREDRGR